jgi:hypothetical protein
MSDQPVYKALEEWRAAKEDLQRAVYSTFDDTMRRYACQIAPGTILGNLADSDLPLVDFDAWYATVRGTMGGMIGSATLSWPIPRLERVAMQRQLVLRLGDRRVSLLDLGHYFFHSSRLNDHIHDVLNQIVEPFHRDLLGVFQPHLQTERAGGLKPRVIAAPALTPFVGEDRIAAFEQLHDRCGFDLRKAVALLNEMNTAWDKSCWFSLAFLVRCFLDHVPPAFDRRTFADVSAQEGGRSFKEACQALDTMARKIADSHLHTPMRERDALPNAQQTNASQALDLLLSETIIRLERKTRARSQSAST